MMTYRFKVIAEYTVKKELLVTSSEPDGGSDPAQWKSIEFEHDVDCWIGDVVSAEQVEDQ